jgi:hypothetical protein
MVLEDHGKFYKMKELKHNIVVIYVSSLFALYTKKLHLIQQKNFVLPKKKGGKNFKRPGKS